MPTIPTAEAAEKLAKNVEQARPHILTEIYNELFPRETMPASTTASGLAEYIRNGLEPEEIVDLWNVVFPRDRRVRYDEEDKAIHYNEYMFRHGD